MMGVGRLLNILIIKLEEISKRILRFAFNTTLLALSSRHFFHIIFIHLTNHTN